MSDKYSNLLIEQIICLWTGPQCMMLYNDVQSSLENLNYHNWDLNETLLGEN